MLILTRKPGPPLLRVLRPRHWAIRGRQIIKIQPAADLPLTTPVGALFEEGPIEIVVQRPLLCFLHPRHSGIPAQQIQGQQVRIGIQAHDKLLILREELEEGKALPTPSQATS